MALEALAPADAVARPLALLDAMGPDDPPVRSWSTVTAPALVLGRAAREPALEHAALRAAGVTVLRRRSGGGPVLWDAGLLSLDLLLPRGHPLAPEDVVAAYRPLGEAVAAALRGLGVAGVTVVTPEAARADRVAPHPAHAACFGALSPYEVTVAGRKVVGLSQARRRQGVLLQAGIALTFDAAGLGGLLAMEGRERAAFTADLEARAGGLPGLAAPAVVAAVERALCAPTATPPAGG